MNQLFSNAETRKWTIIKIISLLTAIILSITVLRAMLVNQKTYQSSMNYLDEKMETASMLAVGTTSASLVVSLLPDDTGSAIADELAEFTGYLLLVDSAIFLERYLLTTIGFISSAIVLPMGFLFIGLSVLSEEKSKAKLKEYAFRLLIFGVCIVLVIPLGCACGRAIEKANASSIQSALSAAKEADEMVEAIPDETEEDKNIFSQVGDFFVGMWKNATDGYEWAKTTLSSFMASVAVMLVTTIAIPILMAFCFVWLIKFLTKRDFVIAIVGYADGFTRSVQKRIRRK